MTGSSFHPDGPGPSHKEDLLGGGKGPVGSWQAVLVPLRTEWLL